MEGLSTARQTRVRYRHELRTLTYVTLDHANGGVVRNLTQDGIGVQLVTPVRPYQQLSVRFELRYPRLFVSTRGEVVWSTFSGQCGIRFLNLPLRVRRQINEWIFNSLLEGAALQTEQEAPTFASAWGAPRETEMDDGLVISPAPSKVIELPAREPEQAELSDRADALHQSPESMAGTALELDWLSQPLSGRSLAWTVDVLMVVAALLLFALVFLAVTRDAPRWPLAMALGAAAAVTILYWGFFEALGGASLGARLARMTGAEDEADQQARVPRFR